MQAIAGPSSGPLSPHERARAPLRPMSSLSTARLEEIARNVCDTVSTTGRKKQSPKLYNWGGSFVCQPSAVFSPTSVDECCVIVELARRIGGIEVRAMGRSHSPGDIVFTQGWILNMHALDGLLSIDGHADVPSVSVLAGTYVSDMHNMLEKADPPLAMKNVGSISEQTVAGLVATATHGTGLRHPVISASVQSMRIVVAMDEEHGGTQVVSCSRDENAELFNASLCGLGATGLIVEVTMAVDHWFKLKQIAEECTFDSLFGPSTGSPSVEARAPVASVMSPRAHTVAVQTDTTSGNTLVPDETPEMDQLTQKQSIGWLLAHNRRLLPESARRYPRTQPTTDASRIFPISSQEALELEVYEQDDETTRTAQRALESLAASSQHVRMAWAPQAGMVTLMRINRTLEPVQSPGLISRIYGRVVGYHMLQLLFFMARYNAALPSKVNKAAYYLTHPSKRRADAGPAMKPASGSETQTVLADDPTMDHFSRDAFEPQALKPKALSDDPIPVDQHNPTSVLVDSSYRVLNVECLFKQYTNEWALPLSQAGAALRAMRDWIEEEERMTEGTRIHFPVEIRFAAADGIWLSPCHDRVTCYIGIVLYRPYNLPNRYRELFTKYEALMRHFGGRPHWAKAHTCGPMELRRMYPNLPDYLRVRQQFDPEGVFLNPYVRRHLLGHVSSDVSPRLFKSHL